MQFRVQDADLDSIPGTGIDGGREMLKETGSNKGKKVRGPPSRSRETPSKSPEIVIPDREIEIQRLSALVRDASSKAKIMEQALYEKDNQINVLSAQVQRMENKLSSMEKSIVWQMKVKIHDNVIDSLLPKGSKRRRTYADLLANARILFNDGWDEFQTRRKTLAEERSPRVPIIDTNPLQYDGKIPLDIEKGIIGKFISPVNGLNGLSFITATYRQKNCSLNLTIIDPHSNSIIRTSKRRNVSDSDYTNFIFKPIKDSKDRSFLFQLMPVDSRVALWYNPNVNLGALQLIVDGKKIGGCINFRAYSNLKIKDPYEIWYTKNEPSTLELKSRSDEAKMFLYRPKISIITPVYNVDERWLRLAILSVINQAYDNWELCIVDGGSTKPHISRVIKEYAKKDSRIKANYLTDNKGIAGNSNEALALATGEFISFLDHDDELSPFSLYEVVKLLNSQPNLDFIYSDEDKIGEDGRRFDYFFKPDWNPDLFLSCNYLCHLSVVRRSIIDKIDGFRYGYDGSQDYDLFLRAIENVDVKNIAHICKILYHWRTTSASTAAKPEAKPYAYAAAKKALADSLNRRNLKIEGVLDGLETGFYRIKYKISGNPKVSIIIPTRDKVDVLSRCIDSIIDKTEYKNYDIVIIDNNSQEKKTFKYYDGIKVTGNIRMMPYNQEFNFSAIINYAAGKVDSEYILLLNNDIEVISPEWLSSMLEHAQREEVGAVGAKLLYFNNTIQHAGVITGIIGNPAIAGHVHRYLPSSNAGYFGRTQLIQDVSAVTAACMLTKRSVFNEVGGLDEESLKIAFNDIDYCLKLRSKGYLVVFTPYALLYHHESLSRGHDYTLDRQKRFQEEVSYMRVKWGKILDNDPYYNPNLTRNREDFSLRI